MDKEKKHLCNISAPYVDGQAQLLANQYVFSVLVPHFRGKTLLEIGPAEGTLTELLAQTDMRLTLLEPTEHLANALAERFPLAEVTCDLIEEYDPPQHFDSIVLSHVLEHVHEPVFTLRRIRGMLSDNGVICVAVPNGYSLHRQAGVLMGTLPHECALNERDVEIGHRRVFSPDTFRQCFIDANLRILHFGGYWLKPLNNAQLNEWSKDLLHAYFTVGERYPEIAAEMYIIADAEC